MMVFNSFAMILLLHLDWGEVGWLWHKIRAYQLVVSKCLYNLRLISYTTTSLYV